MLLAVRTSRTKHQNNKSIADAFKARCNTRKLPRELTKQEVAKHDVPEDCWIIFNGKVYDITLFLDEHPGGQIVLLQYAGKDATEGFSEIGHSEKALKLMEIFFIGDLVVPFSPSKKEKKEEVFLSTSPNSLHVSTSTSPTTSPSTSPSKSFLSPVKGRLVSIGTVIDSVIFTEFKVTRIGDETPGVKRLRLQIPNNGKLGVPPGRYISVCDTKQNVRHYNPILDEAGYFELLVKVYPNGQVSQYISSLSIGSLLSVRGYFGNYTYRPRSYLNIGMIAAGTGVTPMFQIAKAIIGNPSDSTTATLIYLCKTERDLALKHDLDHMANVNKNFNVHYVLTEPHKGWKGGTKDTLSDQFVWYLPTPHVVHVKVSN